MSDSTANSKNKMENDSHSGSIKGGAAVSYTHNWPRDHSTHT